MCSSDKKVYAPRAESGHANSRNKVRSTWPKVIVTYFLTQWESSAYGLGFSLPRSTAHDHLRPRATNLSLAVHSPAFVSLRVRHYFFWDFSADFLPCSTIFLYKFIFVWGWFTPIELFNRIEDIVLFISHHDTIYAIGFIPEDCLVLCETVKSSLNIPYVRRLFHTLKMFFRR